ncbi:MarR family winged helix-turn-helix transcriptional regulator [Frondihabitans cladoniiphilus]|uniref:MarR family transcriptional regulator TamR n=1 Tax=Frondihabitans cladoniiphilus TaxID=715785 RepID=A0ABP8W6W4_9MICO
MNDNDEVDLLIDAWAGQLPEIDFTPLDVMSRLRRVSHRLTGIRRAAFGTADLAIWEFDVLAALRRAGEPFEMSPAQLLTVTMVTSGTLTQRVDHLEERGLVGRRKNPEDGRSVLVQMTPLGRERVDRAMIALVESEERALEPLSRSDRAQLVELLRALGEAGGPPA